MAKESTTAAAGPAAGTTEAAPSLLDQAIETFTRTRKPEADAANKAKSVIESLIRQAMDASPGSIIANDVEKTIKLWQAEIDRKISVQLNKVLHHEKFQKLEGTWRGLDYFVKNTETSTYLKLRVLNASKKTLLRDLQNASEFDQSLTFKKIYTAEYDQLGGTPYGLLVGDYDFSAHPEDMDFLQKMAGVAASSHAPFVSAASPKMLDLESYTGLNQPRDLAKIFESEDYTVWRSFRDSPDSKYVALTLPRVLARLPYGQATKPVDEFRYEEGVDGTNHEKYCWMNAAWAYATRVTDAFAKDGWFMRTRGVESGGKVEGLPIHVFQEGGGKAVKCPTEVLIPDRRENELSNLGFLPLLHCKNTDYAAFLGAASCNKPATYRGSPEASASAELSAKLSYMLCSSRFAHYLKVIARDKIGSFMERQDCEEWLKRWIANYVSSDPHPSDEVKARYPLAEAEIKVEEIPGAPGSYNAVAWLRPWLQLEELTASLRMVAKIPASAKGG